MKTALEAFEARKANITQLLVKINSNLGAYDRDISTVPGGHSHWSHARTLANVERLLQEALDSLTSARANTRIR